MPLHFVLQRVREMEKSAKNDGRNRLAIAVLKHSGESHEAIIPWHLTKDSEGKRYCKNVDNLKRIIDYLTPKEKNKQAAFSDTFIRSIERELYLLTNQDGTLYEGGEYDLKIKTLAHAEIKRLIKRSADPALPNKEEVCEDLYHLVTSFLSSKPNIDDATLQETNIENFLELMKVALFIKGKSNKHYEYLI
jgi:CRISPR/Cas system-associated protein Cas10 (large subunit of type III CRISPR-Cas system)